MAVPKRKTSKSRRNNRRSHHARELPAMSVDKKTKSVHRPHHVDLATGFYRGKQILFTDDAADTQA
jgi:large subunit ribosomal protein L32